MATRDSGDPRRHRGGKEHGLSRGGRGFEDEFDVFCEAHVEHLVGLVEYHSLDVFEVQRVAPNVVDGPTGCCDDHVDTAAQRLQLTPYRLAAVDRHYACVELASVLVHRFGHLHGKLARGHEYERGGCVAATTATQAMQDR